MRWRWDIGYKIAMGKIDNTVKQKNCCEHSKSFIPYLKRECVADIY